MSASLVPTTAPVKTPTPVTASTAIPTIAAIATPQGSGGVSIIRISGSRSLDIAQALTGKQKFTPRYAHIAKFYTANGEVLDEGLVLYFKAPHSFTGDDVVELHGHGGAVLANMLLGRVFELGAQQAVAGEFSARAFANDKLDLVQAESIADGIAATSEAAAMSAMRSLSGVFSDKIHALLEKLIELRLHVEAAIDFPEEDVDFLADGQIEAKLRQIDNQLSSILATSQQGQLLRDGVQAVIAGRPNAGKSSLLNQLAGSECAIVTDVAGTTRDTLAETIQLNGLTLTLTDTAGLRETDDVVEQVGIDRARSAIASADVLLLVHDLSRQENPLTIAKELFGSLPKKDKLIIIGNKSDLLEPAPARSAMSQATQSNDFVSIAVSCKTGAGLDALKAAVCDAAGFHPPENVHIARTRHIDALKRVTKHLHEAREQLVVFQAGELVAENLKQAQLCLSEITGEFTADDLLGEIFGSFCIGK